MRFAMRPDFAYPLKWVDYSTTQLRGSRRTDVMMETENQVQSYITVDDAENPSAMVIDLIADLEGVDPVELSPPLYSAIDPDALDALFRFPKDDAPQTSGYVHFEYHDYEIRIQSDGEIAILNR